MYVTCESLDAVPQFHALLQFSTMKSSNKVNFMELKRKIVADIGTVIQQAKTRLNR